MSVDWLAEAPGIIPPTADMVGHGYRKHTPMDPRRCFSCGWAEVSRSAGSVVWMRCSFFGQDVPDDMICEKYAMVNEAA